MTTLDDRSDVVGLVPAQRGPLSRLPALRPLSPTPTYLGLAVVALGFAIVAVAWGKVAGESAVALQLPYVLSGGVAGLATVMVGCTAVSVAARRRDAALREQQTHLFVDAVRELSAALDRAGEQR